MKVLVVGSGGREAAIVWRLLQSSPDIKVYCAPGNAGIAHVAGCVDIKVTDIDALVEFAKLENVNLVIVGPEMPLVMGLADRLREVDVPVCGPSAHAAEAEGSKLMFKHFLVRNGHRTARFKGFHDKGAAYAYLQSLANVKQIVIKASGLMAGKGVFLPDTLEESMANLNMLMVPGEPGEWVVIERRETGPECSMIALVGAPDKKGKQAVYPLPLTRDYKRLRDGDKGPNTGGMGACTLTLGFALEQELKEITEKVVKDLAKEGRPFVGFLYLGFMLTPEGPTILEANCRMGDPETEVIMMAMGGNFLDLCMGAATGNLETVPPPTKLSEAVCVVLASREYPASSTRDESIAGLPVYPPDDSVQIFHAGTGWRNGEFTTNKAGRILVVAGRGESVPVAREEVYQAVCAIDVDDLHYRHDIGQH